MNHLEIKDIEKIPFGWIVEMEEHLQNARDYLMMAFCQPEGHSSEEFKKSFISNINSIIDIIEKYSKE